MTIFSFLGAKNHSCSENPNKGRLHYKKKVWNFPKGGGDVHYIEERYFIILNLWKSIQRGLLHLYLGRQALKKKKF